MSCPHTDTTAVLAAFGEAPVEFEDHLDQCSACRASVQEHTETLAVLEPLSLSAPEPSTRWTPPAVWFLLAAAALLAIQFSVPTTQTVSTVTPSDGVETTAPDLPLFDDPLDDDLASLEIELALYYLEES